MSFDHCRVEISAGLSFEDTKIKNLARSHPFTQQLDLIFPSNTVFQNALETSLKAPQYVKLQLSLSKIVADNASFIQKYATQSGISFLSAGSGPKFSTQEEDVWCIDHRGVLTLSVCKDTYDALGLAGKRVAFGKGKAKQGDGRHVISIPLYTKEAESTKVRAQREAAFKRWEERRTREVGSPLWNVLAFSESLSAEDLETTLRNLATDRDKIYFETIQVQCQNNVSTDIHIPIVQLTLRPQGKDASAKEEVEDWYETIEELFEWVGMAGFGATRLKANDRVDPFVAVYDPPSPSRVGNVTHMRWSGFIGPSFVQSLIGTITHQLSQSPPTDCLDFISLTSHACIWSPVSYISPKVQQGAMNVIPPLRDPTREVEDSWCLIMTSGHVGEKEGENSCAWVLAESVGKHDARFG
ncbi:ribonuclease P 40kDa subunit-domain-containing protein [Rhodocollybia butyracea]|uniref:Ribonuclease P 40kDa subunit-domain-containing protein n=1 Tax=Rhodocollybia butyracea TaxID=206335 RepID=A0A9P5PVG4_9AGAR|nr:ribonuclease P 40kDa subunit-domain-containing protein [Rhodocollybia butyracea]